MIWQQLRKVDDSYIVTIPKEEVERLNLREGQLLAIEIHPSEIDSAISTDVSMAFEESW
jgi:bifunctional DNA-binding transcriptional regulator/antitoxin component of YhaV-PrlF toxin-antitoxin module